MPAACTSPRTGWDLSGTSLKLIACVSMLLDHVGAACLEATGLIEQSAALNTADVVLRYIGRLAFPLYCLLLVDGFCHTHSVKRYALRMGIFALVSEVPFDLAFFGRLYPGHQNVYFTLLLGLACLCLLRLAEQRLTGAAASLAEVGAVLLCGGAAWLLRTDYDFFGVAFIAVLYLFRQKRHAQLPLGAALCAWEITAPLAFVPAWFYHGRRGSCPRWAQYAFYLFYPLHLTLLAAAALLLLR